MSYAMTIYNQNCLSVEEFHNDLKKIKYLKRLFNRYFKEDDLQDRLILNHLIVLHNVFGPGVTKILFFRLEDKFYPILKTFLAYLEMMPDTIQGVKPYTILNTNIPIDTNAAQQLRELNEK